MGGCQYDPGGNQVARAGRKGPVGRADSKPYDGLESAFCLTVDNGGWGFRVCCVRSKESPGQEKQSVG